MTHSVAVDPQLWNQTRFRSLSDRAKLAYFFVASHPHWTSLGALRATLPGLTAELGWKFRVGLAAFTELLQLGLLRYCDHAPLVWIRDFLLVNRPENVATLVAWRDVYQSLPECELRRHVADRVVELAASWGPEFQQALPAEFVSPPLAEPVPPIRVSPVTGTTGSMQYSGTPEDTQGDQWARRATAAIQRPSETHRVHATPPDIHAAGFPGSRAGEGALARGVRIPEQLQSERFLDAWCQWQAFCYDDRRTMTADDAERQLQLMARWGADASVAAIEKSITKGWKGILTHTITAGQPPAPQGLELRLPDGPEPTRSG